MPVQRIVVRAKPNARRQAFTLQDDGTWLAELRSAPVDGKANAELIALVAEHFGCPKRNVVIRRGAGSRHKELEVELSP